MRRSNHPALLRKVIWVAAWCLAASTFPVGTIASSLPDPLSPQAREQTSPRPDNPQIVAVRVVSETGEVLEENPPGLPLRAGQTLSEETVRESLRKLYRGGRYAEIRAETLPMAGGVQLDFVVRQNFYVNEVHVAGLREPPGEPQALASLRLGLGEVFRDTEFQEGLERLRQTLREEGFFQAQFETRLSPRADTRQMDILVRVTPGLRARLGAILLRNQTEFPDPVLLRRSKLKAGRRVTSARLERAAERIRKFLVARGHLGAHVALRRGDYDPRSNTQGVSLEVAAGPRVRVEVAGARIPTKELRKVLPIYQEGSVDEDLLQEGRRAIRDHLEREGYFDAQVRYSSGEAPASPDSPQGKRSELVITYHVERGSRHRLVGLAFDGNRYFDDELLRSRLQIQPGGFAARGRFSHRLLQDDAASIRDLYVANGFREAQVRADVTDDYHRKGGDLLVRFHIEEGSQTQVAGLQLEGNRALDDDTLLGVIGSTAGQPYSEFNVAGDRDNILALYYNEGFPEARFTAIAEEEASAAPAPGRPPAATSAPPKNPVETRRVRLRYRIVEGTRINVARVLVGGYEHTRQGVVEREVLVKPGGPLREGEVVETQRRLYNLGVFGRVSIAPQNPRGADPAKTLVVLVEEAKRYTMAYGFGLEVQRLGSGGASPVGGDVSASPRGLFEIAKANFTGRADTLSFKARASTLQSRALLSYTGPNFFSRPAFSLQLTGFADKTRDVRTFTSTRVEGSVQLAQRVSLVSSMLYRYSFRRVEASALRISPQRIPLFSQPTKVSSVGVTWVRERRNNPADATRGDFTNVDLSIAAQPIGSSASFLRLFLQESSFHPFRKPFVLARSVRFGVQTPMGTSRSTDIPLPERFFAGGGNSLRGFGLNQAGPRDPETGFPVGGQAMLIFNQELRFPMRLPVMGTRLGGALFYDAGNVFSRVGRINLGTAPSRTSVNSGDLNYFSHTIGFGFRYATPIGPVRVDLGYLLNPAQFQVSDGRGGRTLTRLPRFQFFFNFGSIF